MSQRMADHRTTVNDEYEYKIRAIKLGKLSKKIEKVNSISKGKDKWTEDLIINGKKINVDLDTGADCSVISYAKAKS